jgi:hypothetical protein
MPPKKKQKTEEFEKEELTDETGERFWKLARRYEIGRGCPFTFEYEGDTYEVDGTSETNDYGGIPQGLKFEGTLTKNGKQSCEISMEDEVNRSDIVEHNVSTEGDFEKLGFVSGSEEEQAFIDELNEYLEQNVVGAYDFPSGHE